MTLSLSFVFLRVLCGLRLSKALAKDTDGDLMTQL
jgi:hypothetical protein